jgi:hypothetical protein
MCLYSNLFLTFSLTVAVRRELWKVAIFGGSKRFLRSTARPPTPAPAQPPKQAPAADRRELPPPNTADGPSQRRQGGQSRPMHHQAINQALPSGTKRSASPSSHGPNKSRRTDLPSGPRAMLRDGRDGQGGGNHRSKSSRKSRTPWPRIPPGATAASNPVPPVFQNGMVPGVDMNAAMAAQMTNPLILQEMMMNQMALMAQMAGAMGMVPPGGLCLASLGSRRWVWRTE